jgi:competence protein ComEA
MEPSSAPWRVLEPAVAEPPEAEARPASTSVSPWVASAAVVVVFAAALGAFLLASRGEPEVSISGASGSVAGFPVDAAIGAPDGAIVVDVGGAVVRPGVYRLAAGSRIADAIAAAGGYGPRVDADAADRRLNLAAQLRDGDEVTVPSRDDAAAGLREGIPQASGATGARPLVDLNTATSEQLDTLPGIGPATAAKIIAAREEQRFRSVDDLGARHVVGSATLEKIRALVTVGP